MTKTRVLLSWGGDKDGVWALDDPFDTPLWDKS